LLLTLAGPQEGSLFPLHATSLRVGRDGDVDIVLSDDAVSGRHALVMQDATGTSVEDLGSRNGTFVNEERVEGRRHLSDGDRLRVGNTVLKFSLLDELEEHALTSLFNMAVRDPLTHTYNRRHPPRDVAAK
jgi:pSer/pThr/pTyr-binding forkhead associated (FHA) protein